MTWDWWPGWNWFGWGRLDRLMMLGNNVGAEVSQWVMDELELGRRAAWTLIEQRDWGAAAQLELELQLYEARRWLDIEENERRRRAVYDRGHDTEP